MTIELEVRKALEIPEGMHKGGITRIEERTEPYHYIDIYVSCDDFAGGELKLGCPARLSDKTKLGKTLANFMDLSKLIGQKVNLEDTLIGVRVQYITMNEVKGENTYARIVDGSLKPLPDQPTPQTDKAKAEFKTEQPNTIHSPAVDTEGA